MRTSIFALAIALTFGFQATAQEVGLDGAPPDATEAPWEALPATAPAPAPTSTPTANAAPAPTPATPPPTSAPTQATPPVSKIPAPVVVKKETKIGQVSQIFRDKKRAIMTIDPSVADAEVPPQVVVQLPAGEACEGKVLQAQGGKALIDFADCSSFDKVKMSAAISPPLFVPSSNGPATEAILLPKAAPTQPAPTETLAQPAPEEQARTKFSVGLGHHSGTEFRFNDANFYSGGATDTGTYSFTLDGALQLTLAAIRSEPNSWGFFAGITFEQKRDLKFETVTLDNGGTSTAYYVGERPTVQFTLIEANAIYRWNTFYIPFGLNYSLVKFTQPSSSTSVVDASGSMGAQLGIGFYVTDQFRIELLSQVIAAKMNITTPTVTAKLGTGSLSGMVLRFAYDF